MPNLLPENDTLSEDGEVLLAEFEDEVIGYKKSVYFDSDLGDFIRDGSQSLIESSELDAWIQWCKKCMETPRYSCIAYSDDFGIDTEEAFASNDREHIESILTNEITEALAADPYGRTEYVGSIDFYWIDADSVQIECEVVGIDGVSVDLQTTLAR